MFSVPTAQSHMMGRGFYSPLHSVWGTAFGSPAGATTATAKHYASSSSSPSSFGYPMSHPVQKESDDYSSPAAVSASSEYSPSAQPSSATSSSPPSAAADFKPTSEQLMGYGMHSLAGSVGVGGGGGGGGGGGRKMPEGTTAASSSSPVSTPYPYYSSPELAAASMYGMAAATSPFVSSSRNSFQPSRPKTKARTNAGKKPPLPPPN